MSLTAINRYFFSLPPNLQGTVWMLIASCFWLVNLSMVKTLSSDYSPAMLSLIRTGASALLLTPILLRSSRGILKVNGWWLMVGRGVFGAAGSLAAYYAIANLPLSQFNAIVFSKPLFVMVLAVIILGERLGLRRIIAALIGFIGILIIVQPGGAISPAVWAALGSAMCYAIFNILAKLLTAKNSVMTVLVYSNLLIALILVPFAMMDWHTPTLPDFPKLGLMAFCGVFGQGLYIKGLSIGEASFVSNVEFVRLPMTAVADLLFFKLLPPPYIWPGAALIIGSLIYISWRESKIKKPPD